MKNLLQNIKFSTLMIISFFLILNSCKKTENPELATTITDIDGNTYSTIKMGNQYWMAENLKTTRYADGTPIAFVENTSAWDSLLIDAAAMCYFNNLLINADIYGALYTWQAAMKRKPGSDTNTGNVQGVCPDGWHLPGDEEWKELEMYLGMTQTEADNTDFRGTNEGSELAGNAELWVIGALVNDTAFGSFGFTALPAGRRFVSGNFSHMSYATYFWSATERSATEAWYRGLTNINTNIRREGRYKNAGFSVRCIKD
jgi:uncharacterized protein (TIGR02145 family)